VLSVSSERPALLCNVTDSRLRGPVPLVVVLFAVEEKVDERI